MATPLSPTCQKIDNKIKALENTKNTLAKQLQHASPGQKPDIAAEIKELNKQISAKKNELTKCIKDHPFVPPAPPKPNPCIPQKKQWEDLLAAQRDEIAKAVAPLQKLLHQVGTGEKADIVAQIREKTAEIKKKNAPKITAKHKEYDNCIIVHKGKLALNAIFKGKATLITSNENAKGPFKKNVTIGLWFREWDRREVRVTSFPPISVTYDTHSIAGTVTTTVSLTGSSGGTYDPHTHLIGIVFSLFFAHSTELAGDSRLDVSLHTSSLLTDKGKITLEGSSQFKEGYLEDDTCWITVTGTISPHPDS
jgi:uncharacterized phage infection (PIP) family protein YhgE